MPLMANSISLDLQTKRQELFEKIQRRGPGHLLETKKESLVCRPSIPCSTTRTFLGIFLPGVKTGVLWDSVHFALELSVEIRLREEPFWVVRAKKAQQVVGAVSSTASELE